MMAGDALGLRELEDCAACLLEKCGAAGTFRAGVKVCGGDEMRELHRRFLGDESLTDVMAFPSEAGEDGRYLGDIAVSPDFAREQAARRGHGCKAELQFCVLHGLLHLLGMEDRTPAGKRRMLTLQRKAMAKLGIMIR